MITVALKQDRAGADLDRWGGVSVEVWDSTLSGLGILLDRLPRVGSPARPPAIQPWAELLNPFRIGEPGPARRCAGASLKLRRTIFTGPGPIVSSTTEIRRPLSSKFTARLNRE